VKDLAHSNAPIALIVIVKTLFVARDRPSFTEVGGCAAIQFTAVNEFTE
jgi:hypothetical protein